MKLLLQLGLSWPTKVECLFIRELREVQGGWEGRFPADSCVRNKAAIHNPDSAPCHTEHFTRCMTTECCRVYYKITAFHVDERRTHDRRSWHPRGVLLRTDQGAVIMWPFLNCVSGWVWLWRLWSPVPR